MISWRMAAAWVAALVVATVLTWQIVGLADSQVGEAPVAVAPSLTTTTEDGSPTPSTSPSTSTAGSSPTTTTPGAGTNTSSSSSSSTSSSPSTSTSTTTQWSLRTVSTIGGLVVLRYRPGEVELQAATPAPGFAMEVDDAGPPRVRVEFESDDTDVRVEARWDNGALDVDIDD